MWRLLSIWGWRCAIFSNHLPRERSEPGGSHGIVRTSNATVKQLRASISHDVEHPRYRER